MAHIDDIPISEFNELSDLSIDEHSDEEPYNHKELSDGDNNDGEDFSCPSTPVLFDQ